MAASLLISVPQMLDPNFDHTVVLLIDHTPEGAFGLVINRATDRTLAEFCAGQGVPFRGPLDARIGSGGPVEPSHGFLLYREAAATPPDEGECRLADGLWFGTELTLLARLAVQDVVPYRLVVGYSGWGPGQLDRELAAGVWIPAPLDPDLVFHDPMDGVWRKALGDMGINPATVVPGCGAVN
jgi:putative transcriptional regulator